MFRTIKSKISMIYMQLVLMIALVGIIAGLSLNSLTHAIDGLMTNNYKSINAISNMVEAIEGQDSAILIYISGNRQMGLDMYLEKQSMFQQAYHIEVNNITEASEQEYVNKINNNYKDYVEDFKHLQKVALNHDTRKAGQYYETTILKKYETIKKTLQQIKQINELAMFNGKATATKNSQLYLYMILVLSAIAASGGWFVSQYFANKILNPLQKLTKSVRMIKSIDDGNISNSNSLEHLGKLDEISELSREFSNMTQRLREYDESNLGLIMMEKNRTLAIVRSIKEPLIVLDNDYRILLINSACENIFSITENQAINRHFLEVIGNRDIFEHVSSIYEAKDEFSEKVITITKQNENYYYNIVVAKVHDDVDVFDEDKNNSHNLKINGMVVHLQNVTSFKQLEQSKTDFIASISHEIKTPLTSILMGTSLLEEEKLGELNQKQKDILETIQEDGERISLLVTDLLELSRLEAGKTVFNLVSRSIEDIIYASVRYNFDLALQKNIQLSCEINGEMPIVHVDIEKISWVLNNLITNAIKHSDMGSEVLIKAYVEDQKFYVSVRDTGAGIPEEYLEKIFDRFFQIKDSESEMSGTGLGLSIVMDIMKFHNGEIYCESKLGEGSNFIINLPIHQNT